MFLRTEGEKATYTLKEKFRHGPCRHHAGKFIACMQYAMNGIRRHYAFTQDLLARLALIHSKISFTALESHTAHKALHAAARPAWVPPFSERQEELIAFVYEAHRAFQEGLGSAGFFSDTFHTHFSQQVCAMQMRLAACASDMGFDVALWTVVEVDQLVALDQRADSQPTMVVLTNGAFGHSHNARECRDMFSSVHSSIVHERLIIARHTLQDVADLPVPLCHCGPNSLCPTSAQNLVTVLPKRAKWLFQDVMLSPLTANATHADANVVLQRIAAASAIAYSPYLLHFSGLTQLPVGEPNSDGVVNLVWAAVTELPVNGTLTTYVGSTFMSNKPVLAWEQKIKLAATMCIGLLVVHNHHFPHLNLASNTVYVTEHGTTKIGGLWDTVTNTTTRADPFRFRYHAPEWAALAARTAQGTPLSASDIADYLKANVYSVGVLLWEICMQQLPYANIHTHDGTSTLELSGLDVSTLERHLSGDSDGATVTDIIRACLERDPEQRPTLAHVTSVLHGVWESCRVQPTASAKAAPAAPDLAKAVSPVIAIEYDPKFEAKTISKAIMSDMHLLGMLKSLDTGSADDKKSPAPGAAGAAPVKSLGKASRRASIFSMADTIGEAFTTPPTSPELSPKLAPALHSTDAFTLERTAQLLTSQSQPVFPPPKPTAQVSAAPLKPVLKVTMPAAPAAVPVQQQQQPTTRPYSTATVASTQTTALNIDLGAMSPFHDIESYLELVTFDGPDSRDSITEPAKEASPTHNFTPQAPTPPPQHNLADRRPSLPAALPPAVSRSSPVQQHSHTATPSFGRSLSAHTDMELPVPSSPTDNDIRRSFSPLSTQEPVVVQPRPSRSSLPALPASHTPPPDAQAVRPGPRSSSAFSASAVAKRQSLSNMSGNREPLTRAASENSGLNRDSVRSASVSFLRGILKRNRASGQVYSQLEGIAEAESPAGSPKPPVVTNSRRPALPRADSIFSMSPSPASPEPDKRASSPAASPHMRTSSPSLPYPTNGSAAPAPAQTNLSNIGLGGAGQTDPLLENALHFYHQGDLSTAYGLLTQCAQQGNPLALFFMAECHYFGSRVSNFTQDCVRAYTLYTQALERGVVAALVGVADCCYFGFGCSRDRTAANRCYHQFLEAAQSHAAATKAPPGSQGGISRVLIARAYAGIGDIMYDIQQWDAALESYEKAVSLDQKC
ncbi:protein kinase-like protein [Sorochytrium milnesiophthora]